jgi:hypothetical protein
VQNPERYEDFYSIHLAKKIINALSSQGHLCNSIPLLELKNWRKCFPSPAAAGYEEDVLIAGTDEATTGTPPDLADLSGSFLVPELLSDHQAISIQDYELDYGPQEFCSEMKSFLYQASAVRERSKALRVWKFIRKRFANEEQILKLAESNFKEARKASRKIFKFHKQEWLVRNLSNAPRAPWKGI